MDDTGTFDVFSVDNSQYYGQDPSMIAAEDARFARQNDATPSNTGAVPVVTDQAIAQGTVSPDTVAKLGAVFSNPQQTARDLGTMVGNIQKNFSGLGATFNSAKNASVSANPLATWWQYASTTDKLVVGLAVITLGYMVLSKEGVV